MRPRAALASLVLLAAACAPAPASGQSADDVATAAAAARRAGRYDEALALYARAAAAPTAPAALRRARVGTLLELARWAEAERIGRALESPTGRPELAVLVGEALERQGRPAAAESSYARALTGGASDSLVARLRLGELRWARGDRAAAERELDHVLDAYNAVGGRLDAASLAAVGSAARRLSRLEPALAKDALRAYDEAAAADTLRLDAAVLAGELFLERYNSADARSAFAEVLTANPKHPRALLGEARRLHFDGRPGAADLVRRALDVAPGLAEARAFLALLLLDAEDFDGAVAEAERALAVDSTASSALAALAAARFLAGDTAGFEAARRRALALNPRDGDFHVVLADASARQRRYATAARFAEEATRLDSTAWRAWGLLGINRLRRGDPAGARQALEIAFRGDPYDVWVKNTLDLLDVLDRFPAERGPRVTVLADSAEAPLVAPLLVALGEEAYDRLAERYGVRPPPIRLEVYRRHADFSVRTMGLPGIGALGVSFGSVLAMDAPGARERGDFNWGSTAWHEIAHAFTLAATEHRIPRWMGEGLSVLEERRARPGWGAGPTLDFLEAYRRDRLPPPSRLNDGFVRPAYPEQVVHAYYLASLVCEWIETQHGWPAVRRMLDGYRAGHDTERVVRDALGLAPDELDRRFAAWMRGRFGRALDEPGAYVAQLAQGRTLLEQRRPREALAALERARALLPSYAGHESADRLLARAHLALGDSAAAAAALGRHTTVAESDYEANLELAALLEARGDRAGAVVALERAVWISPYDPAVHVRLAEHRTALGDHRGAVRARQAVVALDPSDRPEALYQLAVAHRAAGDRAAARRAVLGALEVAPAFEKAQRLLLELRAEAGGGAQ